MQKGLRQSVDFDLISSCLSEFVLLVEYALGVKSFGLKAWKVLQPKDGKVKVGGRSHSILERLKELTYPFAT